MIHSDSEFTQSTAALLIGFKRIDFIRKRLTELSENTQIPIIISIDGSDKTTENSFIDLIDFFMIEHPHINIKYRIQNTNLGLAKHVYTAVTEVLAEFDQIIVIEDDIVLSKNFIRNMLMGFEIAGRFDDIGAIGGFSMFTKKIPFFIRPSWRRSIYFPAWGWGINRKSWQEYQLEIPSNYLDLLSESRSWKSLSTYRKIMWGYRFEKVANKNPHTWDYQMQYLLFRLEYKMLLATSRISDNEGFESDFSSHTKGKRPNWMGEKRVYEGVLRKQVSILSPIYQAGDAFTIAGDKRLAEVFSVLRKTFYFPIRKKLLNRNPPQISKSNLKLKTLYKLMYFLRLVGQKLSLTGAKEITSSDKENAKLKLNRNYPLGIKGTEIQLPKDKIIFEFIRLRGEWELKESRFLANELKRLSTSEKSEKIALIDIGTNTGIVTLQAMNLAKTSNACILFEPSNLYAAAIKKNLSNLQFKVTVNEFALSNFDGEATLYIQNSNRGNSSLIEAVIPISEKSNEKVKIRDTREFFNFELTSFKRFVIKCDTQGYDALILSRIPPAAWSKVDAAVIEVWALPSINESDVNILLSKLSEFSCVSWDSDFTNNLDLDILAKFWLSKTSESRNLFIRR